MRPAAAIHLLGPTRRTSDGLSVHNVHLLGLTQRRRHHSGSKTIYIYIIYISLHVRLSFCSSWKYCSDQLITRRWTSTLPTASTKETAVCGSNDAPLDAQEPTAIFLVHYWWSWM